MGLLTRVLLLAACIFVVLGQTSSLRADPLADDEFVDPKDDDDFDEPATQELSEPEAQPSEAALPAEEQPQAEEALAPVPTAAELQARQAEQPQPRAVPRSDMGVRVLSELGFGLLLSLAISAPLALGGLSSSQGYDGVGLMLLGGLLGVGVGYPLGVYVGGNLAGGQASGWSPWVGLVAGIGVGAVMIYAYPSPTTIIMGLFSSLVGPIVGYELSDSNNVEAAKQASSVAVMPTLSVTQDAFVFGVGGRF